MITSNRTFGVELEMGLPTNKSKEFVIDAVNQIHAKAKELGWEIGEDISIKELVAPLEAKSPILKGEKGEQNFREFCDFARNLGFRTNETCGTHVHLGGEDFSKREPLKEVTMREFVDNIFVGRFVPGIIFDADAYELLSSTSGDTFSEFVVQANNDEDFSVMCPVNNGKYARVVRAQLYIPELHCSFNLVIKKSKLRKLLGDDEGYQLVLGKEITVEELVFLSRQVKDRLNEMRDLFSFYTVFDSVLFAMLPKSRRTQNRFCKPLSYSYSYNKIRNIQTVGQFEKVWYGRSNTADVVDAKSQYKHESRRHSVNLHSLLGGIGTVEVRLHDGSLDTEELVKWIELHQWILDTVVSRGMINQLCQAAAQSTELNDKVKLMCDAVSVPRHMRDYIINQIKKNK